MAAHLQLLEALAARIDRLAPSHRDPEAFHTEKNAIAGELRRLRHQLVDQLGPKPSPVWRSPKCRETRSSS